jgi:hypothetical protein
MQDSELLNAVFHYRLCLGKWALMPRDPLETDIMLTSARRCLTKFAFDMSDQAKDDEWWFDIKEDIRVLYSAILARVCKKSEGELFLSSCPARFVRLITNLEEDLQYLNTKQ